MCCVRRITSQAAENIMRGGHVLLIGIACLVISVCSGLAMQQYAISAARGGGVRAVLEQMQELSFFVAAAGMFFYGGIIAIAVGLVLMIIQSRQAGQPPLLSKAGSSKPSQESALEAENRRLREELDRLKRKE